MLRIHSNGHKELICFQAWRARMKSTASLSASSCARPTTFGEVQLVELRIRVRPPFSVAVTRKCRWSLSDRAQYKAPTEACTARRELGRSFELQRPLAGTDQPVDAGSSNPSSVFAPKRYVSVRGRKVSTINGGTKLRRRLQVAALSYGRRNKWWALVVWPLSQTGNRRIYWGYA